MGCHSARIVRRWNRSQTKPAIKANYRISQPVKFTNAFEKLAGKVDEALARGASSRTDANETVRQKMRKAAGPPRSSRVRNDPERSDRKPRWLGGEELGMQTAEPAGSR